MCQSIILVHWILVVAAIQVALGAAIRPFVGGRASWRPDAAFSINNRRRRHSSWSTLRGGSEDGPNEPSLAGVDSATGGGESSSSSSSSIAAAPWEDADGTLENYLGPVVRTPEVWATGPKKRGLILMDAFCPYFGLYMAHQARDVYGVCTISVLSNYMKNFLAKEQPEDWKAWMPESMPMDIADWKSKLPCEELVAVHCESDSGLGDAEHLAIAAQATCSNQPNEARRNKFLMNEVVGKAGINVVRQKLCHTFSATAEFATELLEDQKQRQQQSTSAPSGFFDAGVLGQGRNTFQLFEEDERGEEAKKAHCIVKPIRGVASELVHLCDDIDSVKNACSDILSSAVFGDPTKKHDTVLVQEFAVGTEYAVDIVTRDGEHKVAAIWRYDKRPANGAPFCYFATELIDPTTSRIGASVCQYAKSCLSALGHNWGLSHTEVIFTEQGPRLVEVNCRQHNMDFAPLTMACIGYNAFDMLLAAYLGGQPQDTYPPGKDHLRLDWDSLPDLPVLRCHGAMVHLVSFAGGKLASTEFQHLDEIHNMESVMELEVYPEYMTLGEEITKTTDIRSDAGWVQIINEDPEALKRDYNRIVQLMPRLFKAETAAE